MEAGLTLKQAFLPNGVLLRVKTTISMLDLTLYFLTTVLNACLNDFDKTK